MKTLSLILTSSSFALLLLGSSLVAYPYCIGVPVFFVGLLLAVISSFWTPRGVETTHPQPSIRPLGALGSKLLFIIPSLALFVGACIAPVWVLESDERILWTMGGWELLANGWQGLLGGQAGWYANILFLAAVLVFLSSRWMGSLRLAVAAILVGGFNTYLLATWGFTVSTLWDSWHYRMTSLRVGFFLWMASILLVAIGAIFSHLRAQPSASTASMPLRDSGTPVQI